nr:hypothetical protein [uncultured Achromobacter sp.]
MKLNLLTTLDRMTFVASVAAGIIAAVAGATGWTATAVIAGCVAAVAPIANRLAAAKQHQKLLADIGPRTLLEHQRKRLVEFLQSGPSFDVWIAHNRREGEPASYHAQIFDAFKAAGFDPKWFGGMTNTTIGIEISGAPSDEKARLMGAFTAAGIPFLPIVFTDKEGERWKLAVWIGSNPGPQR